eukprot:TRINITY_DN14888_c0_g1_i1.p1 TRINITY_DN14888_c0_g1~~TRINITY_DN14888_c0_g1_i1.p1  ORF type:complete len:146 (-),score=10.04 TRINITY_DN14888_c0_g1_i1:118-555(-)
MSGAWRVGFVLLGLLAFFVGSSNGQVPTNWTCNPAYYDAVDGCDCECGAWDPDCDIPGSSVYNCDFKVPCVQPGVCQTLSPTPPANWTCNPAYYNANDGCDCECGAPDPDCLYSTLVYNCPDGSTTSFHHITTNKRKRLVDTLFT